MKPGARLVRPRQVSQALAAAQVAFREYEECLAKNDDSKAYYALVRVSQHIDKAEQGSHVLRLDAYAKWQRPAKGT